MHHHVRRRLEPEGLPIVDVDFMLGVFQDPNTVKAIIGVRRQVVEKATQVLKEAKRNQIDGRVELDDGDVGLVLQAAALAIERLGDLLFFQFDDDEQT